MRAHWRMTCTPMSPVQAGSLPPGAVRPSSAGSQSARSLLACKGLCMLPQTPSLRGAQVPSLTVAFLKPDTQLKPGEQAQMGMQPYPGPLKYPFMHSYLTAFASMMGCAHQS